MLSEFKTEAESLNPQKWQRKAYRFGYIFKLAFYARGLSKLKMAFSPSVQFFVGEVAEPNLLALFRVDDELMARESERVIAAIKLWGKCLTANDWPGYSLDGYDMGLMDWERKQLAIQAANNPSSPYYHLNSEDV